MGSAPLVCICRQDVYKRQVSHSENLAKSVVELTSIMAPNARIAPAGGMDGGGFGTSFEKIQAAIESVYSLSLIHIWRKEHFYGESD